MNYHLPVEHSVDSNPLPAFAILNKQLVCPSKVYTKEEYPSLPHSLVKIAAQDGRNIFVPLHKFAQLSSMDY